MSKPIGKITYMGRELDIYEFKGKSEDGLTWTVQSVETAARETELVNAAQELIWWLADEPLGEGMGHTATRLEEALDAYLHPEPVTRD